MKHFLQTIKSSVYDPAFYDDVRTKTLGKGIKVLAILGALGIGLTMLIATPVLFSFAYSDLPQAAESSYPDDLVIRIENGELSINKPEPYYIENRLPYLSGESMPKNLVIFDGDDQLEPDVRRNSTFALVKRKYAITEGQNNQQQIISFSQMGTTTIDKSTVVSALDRVEPYFIPAVLGGGLFLFIILITFGTFFWVLFHMVYLLLPTGIVFLFMWARRIQFSFREAYMVALYASLPVAVAFYVVFSMLLNMSFPPFLYTLAVVLIAALNLVSTGKLQSN